MSEKIVKIDYRKVLEDIATRRVERPWWRKIANGFLHFDDVRDVVDLLSPGVTQLLQGISQRGQLSSDDTKNISEIIAAGRLQGAEELEITVSKQQLIGLKAGLAAPLGAQVSVPDLQLGASDASSYTIKIKYAKLPMA